MANTAAETFKTGLFQTVIDKCEGCERVVAREDGKYCGTYARPEAKWRLGLCNFATHAKPEVVVATVRINPLKAAKRAARRK